MNIGSSPWFLKFEIDTDEVMRSPRPVVVEGKVVIKLLRDLEHASFELRHRLALDQASQVHHFTLVAAFQLLDFSLVAREYPHRQVHVGFPVIIEKAVEHPSDFDLLFLRGLAIGPQ